ELSGEERLEYCVEPKFDGAGLSVVYEDGTLKRGATRGDGIQGDDITTNIKQIRSIPLQTALGQWGIRQLEIRGEVMLTKKAFKQYNEKLQAEGLSALANPRNAASGSLRLKDPKEVARRSLHAYLYHVSYVWMQEGSVLPDALKTHLGTLELLDQCGFQTSFPYTRKANGIQDVITWCHEWEEKRDDLPYEIDGVVIKVNRMDLQEKIGQTTHHPRWAMAFKFKARQATSTLLDVEFQVGRTGSITPVAKIEPVQVGGVTISSISLFNEEVIREKNLMLGDTILIERAGDVIPYVVKSFPELRKGNERDIVFPKQCPVCSEPLFKPEHEAVWRCTNSSCEAQVQERIIHFASKDAMDIRGLGDALVRRFYEAGILRSVDGIYSLPFEQLKGMEGLGEKSAANLQTAIEKSKEQKLHRLLFALGIRFVGETTAKTLARSIHHLHDLYGMDQTQLCTLEDVGEKVAASIVEFFSHPDNRRLIDALERAGVNMKNEVRQEGKDGNLKGKSFLFTGTLQMKRAAAEALVEEKGGQIAGSVSSKLNFLVVGEEAGSKLEKAKKLGTIQILSEEEFLQLIQEAG
ncbi:MAG TPA: NAD-dependent DNA ligase LigA, partial [Chitinophagaceae bacterium]|nr:NAD-dependent DNA ligase LigA [Chitinophagaceae bacterium]